MRLGNLVIAFFAVLALIVGSASVSGLGYWLFTAAVIVAAGALTYVLYVLRSRRWLTESYRLFGEGRVSTVRARVREQLDARQSFIQREVLELMLAELSFWAGEHELALEAARRLDLGKLPGLWKGAVYELTITSSLFTGRTAEAKAVLAANEAALRERHGFHELEALIALREGDAKTALERFESTKHEWPRPAMVRAGLAMLRAEIALALGEEAGRWLEEAISLSGESFVAARARALTTRRSA